MRLPYFAFITLDNKDLFTCLVYNFGACNTMSKFFKNMNFQIFFTCSNSMCIYFAGDVASRNPTFVSEHPSILHGNKFLDIVQQHLFLDLNWGLEILPTRAHILPTRCLNFFRAPALTSFFLPEAVENIQRCCTRNGEAVKLSSQQRSGT